MSKWLEEFKAYALANPETEVCAFVVQKGRKQVLVKCTNEHEQPAEHFTIAAQAWAEAEDMGKVLRVLHSHPGFGARPIPSPLDTQQCNQSEIVWGIYAPDCDGYAEIEPQVMGLEGRAFILGHSDCFGLVMDWHKLQGITLTDRRLMYPWWEDQYPENLYQDFWEQDGFVECDLMQGCMVIMQVSSNKWNHAGIITPDGNLLHHLYGQLSCVTPYKAGYLVDRTVKCVRHKDLPKELKSW